MSHTPHKLVTDFPEFSDKISELKGENPHFARLLDDYNALNDEVHLAESDIMPMEDLTQGELRKKRMALKDELYKMLAE